MRMVLFLFVFAGIAAFGCSNNSTATGDGNSSSSGNNVYSSSSSGAGGNPGTGSSSSSISIPAGDYATLTQGQQGVKSGYGTRYWDGCKPSCSWPENVSNISNICRNCDVNNQTTPAYTYRQDWGQNAGVPSSCDNGGSTYTCFDMAPVKVNDNLAYGYVATAGAEGNVCGKCFQLQFDGKGKYDTKPSHALLNGKTMVVMASNIGYDVGSGHFDILIPGGGLGNFDSFSNQLGVTANDLGVRSGGFLSTCQQSLGWDAAPAQYKSCVLQKCTAVFGGNSKFADLLRGCEWFADWFEAADNPTFLYKEVECPQYLKDKYKHN
ncbi:MAG: hypothetical protein LBH25_07060 [Fibromonadaceae bacterium]|jgi:hypothetical protein|nr:hypothetical protein [Fibromonadaceae bacterium]